MKNRSILFLSLGLLTGIALGIVAMFVVFTDSENTSSLASSADTTMDHENPEEHAEGSVRLSEDELREFGIELGVAGSGDITMHADLTGIIRVDPEQLAHITPRFSGIVKEVRKRTGDKVKKDDIIAIIESNESLVPYEMKSLIDGTIISMHITKGEVISDKDHAVVVANLQDVWIDLNVYQMDLDHISIGQQVKIAIGSKYPEVNGTISYVSPVVDEDTRTAIARVELANKSGKYRPGLFVTGKVTTGIVSVPLIVPKTALETYDGNTVVFLYDGDEYRAQTVSIGRSNDSTVEITAGIEAGQRYVVKGGFTIKAELEKSTLGEGHGH